MTGYVETVFKITPFNRDVADLLTAFLGENGYEIFQDTEDGTTAYIRETLYNDAIVGSAIEAIPIKTSKVTYSSRNIPGEDWNRKWINESFTPVIVENECIIHSPCQKIEKAVRYDIRIHPVMAFGSGHHQTTHMMIQHLLEDFRPGESFLDMGCGTGVLAILASKMGAGSVTAVDIDEMAYENCRDNMALNSVPDMEVILGGSSAVAGRKFDVVAANINRNILLSDMPEYARTLNSGGRLYLSGFFVEDTEILKKSAAENGLEYKNCNSMGEWASLKFMKP